MKGVVIENIYFLNFVTSENSSQILKHLHINLTLV